MQATQQFTANYNVAWILEIVSYLGVNIYALISGYVGINIEFKYRRIIILWLQVLFYSLGLTIMLICCTSVSLDWKSLIQSVCPVISRQYWYFTAYFACFFFFPYFNFLINKSPKQMTKKLIISLFLLFSIIPTFANKDVFDTGNGYSALWLGTLYLVGGYIRKYEVEKKFSCRTSIIMYLICIIVSFASKIFIEKLSMDYPWLLPFNMMFINYTSVTMLFAAICLLFIFVKLKIKKYHKKITFLSSMTFSVYLIHAHPLVFKYLEENRFASYAEKTPIIMAILVISTVLIIYSICMVIDALRVWLFKVLNVKKRNDIIVENLKVRIQ